MDFQRPSSENIFQELGSIRIGVIRKGLQLFQHTRLQGPSSLSFDKHLLTKTRTRHALEET